MKYKIKLDDFEGYGSVVRSDGKLDWGDKLYMTTNPIHMRESHLFPELPSSLRNTLECYFQEMQNLSRKILGMIGKTLNTEIKELEELFEDGMQSVRFNYYPPCSKPELVMGLALHSDATVTTILNQLNGVDGLHIKKDSVWIPVSILPEALAINLGDILETDYEQRTLPERRAQSINKLGEERISIAFLSAPSLMQRLDLQEA
ncbi:hypothetical protein Patl1_10250 [Pistacia atlantica]|uniref:Uncharacterized protein n=1 Tax=Pistacia atlantica TaxID=434234 RepID=A0ACC1A2H0_9ROSI|nr:hypothetical protein Patl1_10250 [Pistacia atlantica]